jgi:RNA polymerase sigma-70 factor (ECF subfamily)
MDPQDARTPKEAEYLAPGAAVDWRRVFAEQLPGVYNYFRFRVGSRPDAEDLTAKTFEKAWKARHRYRTDRAGFSTWLFEIARNVATDHLRAIKVHLPLEAALDLPSRTTPEQEVSEGSDIARLCSLMSSLPLVQRDLLALKYGAALNNRMIAKLTGLTESNVGTTLSRLVRKLRSQW